MAGEFSERQEKSGGGHSESGPGFDLETATKHHFLVGKKKGRLK